MWTDPDVDDNDMDRRLQTFVYNSRRLRRTARRYLVDMLNVGLENWIANLETKRLVMSLSQDDGSRAKAYLWAKERELPP